MAHNMTSKYLGCGVLIVALSIVLATPARADKTADGGRRNRDRNRGGGCGRGGRNRSDHSLFEEAKDYGMRQLGGERKTVTDEKDKRVRVLSGNMVGVKPGDRVTLLGHKSKPKAPDTTLVWETKEVTKDFGVCQP